jgi:hypothetical protein
MIRMIILGLVAAAGLVTIALSPTVASNGNYLDGARDKPLTIKGGISKLCLDHRGDCGLVVW